jgi:hypothetical protein
VKSHCFGDIFEGCRGQTYGYGCSQSCDCTNGRCISTATNVNESCSCSSGYLLPNCVQLINTCGKNL